MNLVTKEMILTRLDKKGALSALESTIEKFHEEYHNNKYNFKDVDNHIEAFKLYNGELFYRSTNDINIDLNTLKNSNDEYVINDLMRLKSSVNLALLLKEKNFNMIPAPEDLLDNLYLNIKLFLKTIERIELALEALNRADTILNGEDGFRV